MDVKGQNISLKSIVLDVFANNFGRKEEIGTRDIGVK